MGAPPNQDPGCAGNSLPLSTAPVTPIPGAYSGVGDMVWWVSSCFPTCPSLEGAGGTGKGEEREAFPTF
jgi:hypothetical protein